MEIESQLQKACVTVSHEPQFSSLIQSNRPNLQTLCFKLPKKQSMHKLFLAKKLSHLENLLIQIPGQSLPHFRYLRRKAHFSSIPQTIMNRLKVFVIRDVLVMPVGVKLLVKADLPMLETLEIESSSIRVQGCKHLSKGRWPNLTSISIYLDEIKYNQCSPFFEGNWKQLNQLNVVCFTDRQKEIISMMSVMVTDWKLAVPYQLGKSYSARIDSDMNRIMKSRLKSK